MEKGKTQNKIVCALKELVIGKKKKEKQKPGCFGEVNELHGVK